MVDIKKYNRDKSLLQDEDYQDEVREMIETLGADPDKVMTVDNDKNIKTIMNAEKLVKGLAGAELFEKDENGRHKIEAKVTAITVMTASIAIKSDIGVGDDKPLPYFTGCSRWLDLPVNTLRRWWQSKEVIMREQTALGYSAVQRSTFRQIELIEKYTEALDLDKKTLKDMAKTPKGILALLRVVSTLSINAKMLNTQGEVLANTTGENKKDKGTKVSVVIPKKLKPKTKKNTVKEDLKKQGFTDVSDVADKG